MRRGEPQPRAFQAPVDVHASADGQVYMFRGRLADSGGSSEEDELNVMELRPRGRDSEERERERVGDMMLLERDVTQGDNLNKLALQYGCKVADIKRVNNLIQDQDLYALKSIKIPVKKHGLLTETNSELREPEASTTSPSAASGPLIQHPLDNNTYTTTDNAHPASPLDPAVSASLTNGAPSVRPQLQQYTDFLKEVDNDIERLIQSTEDDLLVGPGEAGSRSTSRRWGGRGSGKGLSSYGADWGIQWWNAVVAMLLIGIVLPIFYVVYFKTQDSGASVTQDGGVNISITTITSNSSVSSSIASTVGTGGGGSLMERLISKPHT